MKESVTKHCSLSKVNFVLSILFVLTLVFEKAALYGNISFLIVRLPCKKQYFSHFKKRFSFLENLLKVLRPALMSHPIFGNYSPFKNDEKRFLFHLKSSLRSQDI